MVDRLLTRPCSCEGRSVAFFERHWTPAFAGKRWINARLLDGYAERDGRSFIDGREVEVRFLENAD